MSNLEEKSSTAMHSLCQVFISWIHEKKCRKFDVYKQNIQHFVKEIKLKFRLCYRFALVETQSDLTRSSSCHDEQKLHSEAANHSEVTFLSEFVGRVTLGSPLHKLVEQLQRSVSKRYVLLPAWRNDGYDVEKRCRILLISWLSVWICTDLRTFVRAKGGERKETRSRECSLFYRLFKYQDLLPHQVRKKNDWLILRPLCSFFPSMQTWNQQILNAMLEPSLEKWNEENLVVMKQFWQNWRLQLLMTVEQNKMRKYWNFMSKCFA